MSGEEEEESENKRKREERVKDLFEGEEPREKCTGQVRGSFEVEQGHKVAVQARRLVVRYDQLVQHIKHTEIRQ